jgi:signal transduction histidine kinase/ActR/RegA family two-component response regulator
LHPDDREAVLAETARTEETCEPFSMEHRFVTRDGDVLWVQNSAVYMCDENGRTTYMHGVMFDITPRMTVESERSLLREQLVQSQKMEAVGKLAGGVAHDFNNLLTVIQGHAQQAMMQVSETGPFHAILSKINSAAERAADLTRKLLLFSRKQPVDFRILNLNAVITDLVKMLHRLIGEDVTIETGLADDPWTIRADQNSIEQMIMNLAVNARDAMPQGGTLTVRTANVVCGAEEVRGTDGAQPGPYVMLTVSDTGVGMTEKVLGRVFEPFFTTKSAGQGTGLGLSVVYGIVQQHNAFVRVRSTLGEGTTFRIWFPAVSEPQDEPEREGLAQLSTNGEGQRILLIEDEDHVRDMVRLVLEKNGYKVITAATVRDAVEQFAAYGGEFVLAFSDIILPDGNGLQLVDHLRERRPQLDVLLTSGYTGEKLQLHEIQQRGYRFLQKPYNVTELLRAVSELATQ